MNKKTNLIKLHSCLSNLIDYKINRVAYYISMWENNDMKRNVQLYHDLLKEKQFRSIRYIFEPTELRMQGRSHEIYGTTEDFEALGVKIEK